MMSKKKEVLDEVLEALNVENLNLENMEEKLKERRGDFEELIRSHPLLSVAIAFGAGYAIAKMLNSKGRR